VSQAPTRRIVTFDIIRPFFVFAVLLLHAWEHFVGADFPDTAGLVTHYETYRLVVGTVLNYAALYLVGISFFLWGLKPYRLSWLKLGIFGLGVIGLQLLDPSQWDSWAGWSWEVYGFLFVAVFLCRLIPDNKRILWAILIASVVMLSVSLNEWMVAAALTPEPFRTVLFAKLEPQREVIGWFLIPWIFFPLMAFAAGKLVKARGPYPSVRVGFITAAAAAGLSYYFYLHKAEPVPCMLGPHFYQFLFMQSNYHFWNHILAFLAVVVLLLTLEHRFPPLFKRFRWLEKLQWNRRLFLCYFLHFGWIALLLEHKDQLIKADYGIDFIWLYLFVLTELTVQMIFLSFRFYGWIFRRLYSRRGN
jgi:hypothetical protein